MSTKSVDIHFASGGGSAGIQAYESGLEEPETRSLKSIWSFVDELEDAVCGLLEVISRGMNQNGSLDLHVYLLV